LAGDSECQQVQVLSQSCLRRSAAPEGASDAARPRHLRDVARDIYWALGVNNLSTLGRWAFAELTEIYQIESDFKAKVASAFDAMIALGGGVPPALFA